MGSVIYNFPSFISIGSVFEGVELFKFGWKDTVFLRDAATGVSVMAGIGILAGRGSRCFGVLSTSKIGRNLLWIIGI